MGVAFKSEWRPVLAEIEQLTGSPRPVLKVMALRVLREVDEIFRAQGKPAWKPLQPSTIAAKRAPTNKSRGVQALAGLRATFDYRITGDRSATVFSRDPRAIFHEFGTKGPYPIVARNAKALALPFLAGRDSGLGTAGTGKSGRFSLSGLGASRRNTRGSFQTPAGPTRVAYSNVSFRKRVMHPGLPVRRMLPTAEQAIGFLRTEVQAFLTHLRGRRGLT